MLKTKMLAAAVLTGLAIVAIPHSSHAAYYSIIDDSDNSSSPDIVPSANSIHGEAAIDFGDGALFHYWVWNPDTHKTTGGDVALDAYLWDSRFTNTTANYYLVENGDYHHLGAINQYTAIAGWSKLSAISGIPSGVSLSGSVCSRDYNNPSSNTGADEIEIIYY